MSFIAVAIGGSAISGIAGYFGATQAANTQANAANNALQFQEQVYNQNQPRFTTAQNALTSANSNFTPWVTSGQNANYTLGQLLGTNGAGGGNTQPDYSSFFNSPDYQFAQQQGQRGAVNAANAQGLGLSGSMLKDLSSFNSGLATQQYGNYFSRLMQISQTGQNAATGQANVAGAFGNLATGAANSNNAMGATIGNTTQAVGQAQASGIVGGTNAITGGINSGISNSLLANYMGNNGSAYKTGNLTGNSSAVGAGTDAQYNNWALQNGLTSADI